MMIPRNSSGPLNGAKRRHARRFRSNPSVSNATPSGSKKPTGPLASTASAAAVQNSHPARRAVHVARAPRLERAQRDEDQHAQRPVRSASSGTCPQNIHVVASIAAASTATRSPDIRRPSRIVSTTVTSAANTDGSRAVNEVTVPSGNEDDRDEPEEQRRLVGGDHAVDVRDRPLAVDDHFPGALGEVLLVGGRQIVAPDVPREQDHGEQEHDSRRFSSSHLVRRGGPGRDVGKRDRSRPRRTSGRTTGRTPAA